MPHLHHALRLAALTVLTLTAACDSDAPTPDTDLEGTYTGQWTDVGGTFDLTLDLTTADGRVSGEATVSFTMNGNPLTSSDTLTGFVDGEQVRFSFPFRDGLNFSGTAAADGESFSGTIFRTVPGPSPNGFIDVEAAIHLARPE